jgi:hypothetical protein
MSHLEEPIERLQKAVQSKGLNPEIFITLKHGETLKNLVIETVNSFNGKKENLRENLEFFLGNKMFVEMTA